MPEFVSPQDMMDAAKRIMLEGKEPSSKHDWIQVINFFAVNIHPGLEQAACKLLKMIYDIPLEDDSIDAICLFQSKRKEEAEKWEKVEKRSR